MKKWLQKNRTDKGGVTLQLKHCVVCRGTFQEIYMTKVKPTLNHVQQQCKMRFVFLPLQ